MRALSTLAAMQHRTRTSHLSYIEKPTDECERDHPRCDRVPLLVIYRYKYKYAVCISERRSSGRSERLWATLDLGRHKETDSTERRRFAMEEGQVPEIVHFCGLVLECCGEIEFQHFGQAHSKLPNEFFI